MQRLLVIEDEPEVRRHVQQALEIEGYSVLTAADGYEGLRLLREEPVDLVLVDLLMPGMDGLELIRQLRCTSLTAKIIAMSGGIGDWNYLQVAAYLGAQMTLQKPFSRQTLLDVVRAQLSPDSGCKGGHS
ncbi:MAG: response regulator [Nitrospira sp.]